MSSSGILKKVIGHQREIELLEQKVHRFQSGAFLLFGQEGVGKKLIAQGLAQKFLCVDGTGCGTCGPCLQVQKNQNGSVFEILPESGMIRVDEAAKILQALSLRGLQSRRFVIIDEVQLMNTQAANMLLKTLEEPAEGTFFFLITSQRARVLQTIQSRCQKIRFQPLTPVELKKNHPLLSAEVLRKSRGSFNQMEKWMDSEFLEKTEKASRLLGLFFGTEFIENTAWREEWKGRENFEFLLSSWELSLHEAAFKSVQKSDERSKFLFAVFEGVQKLRREMAFNVDAILSLESFWVRVHGRFDKVNG